MCWLGRGVRALVRTTGTATIDVQERIAIVKQMQQVVYDESPYIPLVYPRDLEAANKGKWAGWVRANQDKGAWWYNTEPDTYLAVHQASVAPDSSGGSKTGTIVGAVVAAIFVIIIVVLLLRRRGRRAEAEV